VNITNAFILRLIEKKMVWGCKSFSPSQSFFPAAPTA
jgi:hypothetical protein